MAINSQATYAYGKSAPPPKADEAIGHVMHPDTRGDSTRTSSVKGLDAGSAGAAAVLGRPKAESDMTGPTPTDHVVAPGQRTVTSPDFGDQPFSGDRLINQHQW